MKITKTKLGAFLIKNDIFKDNRGCFFESYNKYNIDSYNKLNSNIIPNYDFIQDNISISNRNVLRGLHFQFPPFQQSKLIQVLNGEIYDVIVNIDKNSQDYGKHEINILDNNYSLIIPSYFAHGFLSLENNCIVLYKVDKIYKKELDRTIIYNDENLNIPWPVKNPILSEKDRNGIKLKDLINGN